MTAAGRDKLIHVRQKHGSGSEQLRPPRGRRHNAAATVVLALRAHRLQGTVRENGNFPCVLLGTLTGHT